MNKNLLIVDDDDSVRASLRRILEQTGYRVESVADGLEAEARFGQKGHPPIDLVLLDLNMPRRDGWDVLEFLRNSGSMLPVIVVTGFGDQLETYRIGGAAVLLTKPVDPEILLGEVHKLLAAADAGGVHRRLEKPAARFTLALNHAPTSGRGQAAVGFQPET